MESSAELPALTERVGWSRRLRGDLDTLILKAIHPEAERRYAPRPPPWPKTSIASSSGRPIRARPDSRGYRLRKFVRRHRLGVIAASVGLAGLLRGPGARRLASGSRAAGGARR